MERETAALIAEYLALSMSLNHASSTIEDFARANQLSWFLGMTLPGGMYSNIVTAVSAPTMKCNFLTVIKDIRGALGLDPLGEDQVASHVMTSTIPSPGTGSVN